MPCGNLVEPAAGRALDPILHLDDEGIQHEPRVADERVVGGHVLVEVERIEGGVDHHLALREGDAVVRGGEAAAHPEDDVGLLEELVDGLGQRPPARAERQRVALRERALALEAGGHRALEQLGELAELRPGLGVVHALARVDHGALGGHQHARGLRHVLRVRRDAGARRRLVHQGLRHLLHHHVHRDLHQHRARPAVLHLGEGPAHGVGHVHRADHPLRPLGDVPVVERGGEVGRDAGDLPRIAAGDHHDGHRVAEGLSHAAEGVLGAGPVLHREDADLPARRDPAHRVRHVQPGALLPHDDGADVGGGGGLEHVVDGIADQELDSLALQDLGDRIDDLHDASLVGIAERVHQFTGPRAGRSARPLFALDPPPGPP